MSLFTRKSALAQDGGIFADLRPNAANFAPLTPVSFLPRSAAIHPERVAVVHGVRRYNYRQFYDRARQLASALAGAGVRRGDTVSAMLPNVPAMVEAHYGVPMLGAVLNTINTRLDAATIAYILGHGEAKVLITDREFAAQVGLALATLSTSSGWFQRLAKGAAAIAFPGERIRFLKDGVEPGSPTQGQALFYFGPEVARFEAVFARVGFVMRPSKHEVP